VTRDELRAFLAPLPDEAILGLTLYGEARGEPIEGMVAVGGVIRNRMQDAKARWGKTYRDVCLKRLQFSCWNPDDADPNFQRVLKAATGLMASPVVTDPALEQCSWTAIGISRGALADNTKGANHYHVGSMQPRPSWAQGFAPLAQRGAHVFYRL
jgi:hypothetical protein